MIKPDPNDPLKIRRWLALLAIFNGIFIFPTYIAVMCIHFKASDSLAESLLHYMGVCCLAPILAYLYAAHVAQEDGE